MKWKKYTIETTTAAEDFMSSMLMELGIEGIEIEDNIKLVNATNPNIETIRNSIVPTQLCQLKTNTSYSSDFGIFEIGRVAYGLNSDNLVDEH